MKLNKDQKRLVADVFGNIAAGWFIVGIIASFFTQGLTIEQRMLSTFEGSIFFLFFLAIAIYMLRK